MLYKLFETVATIDLDLVKSVLKERHGFDIDVVDMDDFEASDVFSGTINVDEYIEELNLFLFDMTELVEPEVMESSIHKFDSFMEANGSSNSIDNKNSKVHKAIKKKSEKSGISFTILKQVYKRGMAAWNSSHYPGTPQQAWAKGRVNSFITGVGGARKADDDLWKKHKKK